MSNFCSDQGRTRVFGEAYFLYAAAGNPRRTQIRAKRAIYGWKLDVEPDIQNISVLNFIIPALQAEAPIITDTFF